MVGYGPDIVPAVAQVAAVVGVRSLAQEFLHAVGAAKKKKKRVLLIVTQQTNKL